MNSGRILILFILLEFFIIAAAVLMHGFSTPALDIVAHHSGILSLFVFSLIFLLHPRTDKLNTWLSPRFYLLYALVQAIHLIALLLYISYSSIKLIPFRAIGGSVVYFFLFSMPWFANRSTNGKISVAKFKTIETVFLYVNWLFFFLTYLPRVQGTMPLVTGNYAEHVSLLGWISSILGIKLTRLISFKKSKRNTRDST